MQRDFVQAEMVKLGKPRDKFWLPKVHAAPPPPPPDAIKLSDDPNAKAAPVEAPKIEDPKTSKDVRRALERAQKLSALAVPDEPDEGSLTGSKSGTSDHEIGDQYIASIKGALLQNYNLPAGMNADQIPHTADGAVPHRQRRNTLRHQADEDVRQSAGRRRVRQRRAADAQGTAASAGIEGHGLNVACEK